MSNVGKLLPAARKRRLFVMSNYLWVTTLDPETVGYQLYQGELVPAGWQLRHILHQHVWGLPHAALVEASYRMDVKRAPLDVQPIDDDVVADVVFEFLEWLASAYRENRSRMLALEGRLRHVESDLSRLL